MKIIVYDFGSTSLKTCLFDLDSEIRLVASAVQVGGEPRARCLREDLQVAGHLRLPRPALHGQVREDRRLRVRDLHELSRRFVKVERTYVPDRGNKKAYERNYKVFKKLYKSNAAHFRALNSNRSE